MDENCFWVSQESIIDPLLFNIEMTMKLVKIKVRNSSKYILIVNCHLTIIYHRSSEKVSRKVFALARVKAGMSLSKKHTLMNAFFNLQVNIVHLSDGPIVARIIIKSINFMKEA